MADNINFFEIADIESINHLYGINNGKLLVVLDCNGTLAIKQWTQNFKKVKWATTSNIDQLWNLSRENKIDILLWSSAFPETLNEFVKQIVPNDIKLIDIFSKTECEEDKEYKNMKTGNHGQFNIATIKNLNVVWNKFPQYNARNTVIFDDSIMKIRKNIQNSYLLHSQDLETNINTICNVINSLIIKFNIGKILHDHHVILYQLLEFEKIRNMMN